MQKTSDQIDRNRTQLEKDLKEAIKQRGIVEHNAQLISREILILRTKKKDLDIALSKAKANIRQLELDISIAKSEFWAARNEGI